MTISRLLVSGLVLPMALGCGGKVLFDERGNASSGAGNASGGTGSASATSVGPLSDVCGATPELVANVPAGFDRIDALAASDSYLAFTVSKGGAATHGNYATILRSGETRAIPAPLRADGWGKPTPRLPAGGSSIALRGNIVYFTFDDSDDWKNWGACSVFARNLDIDLGAPQGRVAFSTSGTPMTALAVSKDGFVFALTPNDPDRNALVHSAAETASGPLRFEHGGDPLVDLAAFDGGFAGVERDGNRVFIGLRSTLETVVARRVPAERTIRQVRTTLDAGRSVHLYTLEGAQTAANVPSERIVRDACTTAQDGKRVCADVADAVLYDVGPESHLVAFDVRPDKTLIVSQSDTKGVRASGQVKWVHDDVVETIGGEGTTGTVDEITAITTHGNCAYWAERGGAGSRVMRAGR